MPFFNASCLKHLELFRPPLPPFLNLRFRIFLHQFSRRFPHRFSHRIPCPLPPRLRLICLVRCFAGLATNEPLPRGQFVRDLFEKFTLFMEWEKSAHPPSLGASSLSSLSSAQSVSVPSSRPVYSLAPSALSSLINTPTYSGLGFLRSSPSLASSRGTETHVLPGRGAGISSRATDLLPPLCVVAQDRAIQRRQVRGVSP